MLEALSIGCVPWGEDCAQVGTPDYLKIAEQECLRYIAQIAKEFSPVPEGVELQICHNPHDYGTYLDVEIRFDSEDPTQDAWAYHVEAHLPEHWDPIPDPEAN